jgi:eukaryotic-like serine/threonine-protein kinase
VPFFAPKGTELVRPLGGGSVFEVALVRTSEATLVCKRLAAPALAAREGRAAMVREARLLSMIEHPALPRLVRVGNDARGPFFLETFAEGTSVRGLVEGWRERGRNVPETLVRHVALLAFEALAEIAELSDASGPLDVVHGDISPDHVLVGPLGEIRFVDLGAARFRGLEPELETDDRGTLPYAAPEVARGDAKPGQTHDVYALAATLVLLATGEPLCEATTEPARLAEVATRGVRRELACRAAGLRREEREVLRAALDPDPAGRPQTARQIHDVFARERGATS